MIFPLRNDTAPILQRLSARRLVRDSAVSTEVALRVQPVQALKPAQRRIPKATFSAQLLALGLHYGMDDLVRKADAEVAPADADAATLNYAKAQDYFSFDARPALFSRWSA